MSIDDLALQLAKICKELRSRTIGMADVQGEMQPIISMEKGMIRTLHVGTTLGVNSMKTDIEGCRTRLFKEGETLDTVAKEVML